MNELYNRLLYKQPTMGPSAARQPLQIKSQKQTEGVDELFNDLDQVQNDFNLGENDKETATTQDTVKKPSILGVTKQIAKTKQQSINGQSIKKKLKPLGVREPWSQQHRILRIDPPQAIQDPKSRRRYKIHIQFQTPQGKKKTCTIRFGDKKGQHFIDHHDPEKRAMNLLRIRKNYDTILNPNYWRIWLLETEDTVEEAWKKYISSPDHNYFMHM